MKNAFCVLFVLLTGSPAGAKVFYVHPPDPSDTGIIIDHNCVDLSTIPQIHIAPAASLRLLLRHASVGQGIGWGLDCFAGLHPTNSECSCYLPGQYPRDNWLLELRAGNWKDKVDDLVTQAAARTDEFDVFTMKFCYIDALGDSHPDWDYYRAAMEQLELDYPDKVFVWWTIPLTRDGMPGTDFFNALVRSYCRANGKILFDIADIECHDPNGLKQTNAQGNEVICADYTKEIHAGHLNVPGRIRVASTIWQLMASIAGWHKGSIQAAIDAASNGDTIIVTPGTYTGPGNRDMDFHGKAITVCSTDPNDPNIVASTIIDCNGTQEDPHRGFYFHNDEDLDSVLAGLTIINGCAGQGGGILCDRAGPSITACVIACNSALYSLSFAGDGGGMYITGSTWVWRWGGKPAITNCTFKANKAHNGAGIYSIDSSPALTNCRFVQNSALSNAGGLYNWNSDATLTNCLFISNTAGNWGGAMRNFYRSCPRLIECTFAHNSARHSGGAISNSVMGSDPTLVDCTLTGNLASIGGAMCNDDVSPTMSGCIFVGNRARDWGGALSNVGSCNISIAKCSFSGNISEHNRGATLGFGPVGKPQGTLQIDNSIISDGAIAIANLSGSPITISYSNVQGGQSSIYDPYGGVVWGNGNTAADPCFADRGYWDPNETPADANDDFWVGGDYRLKSQAGRWNANEGRWTMDEVTSPCIDAGDPMSPIGDEPFPNGGRINMGAYGGTAEASKSYFGQQPCEIIVAGDINGDCAVNFLDFSFIALRWLTTNN